MSQNFICAASKLCSSLFFSTQASLPKFNVALAVMLGILNFLSFLRSFSKMAPYSSVYFVVVCNLSSKLVLYSDIRYTEYLKSVISSTILSLITIFTHCMCFPHIVEKVKFYFILLLYFILLYFILFYVRLFYFTLFYFILFCFILFHFILFYFILFYFIFFYFISFYFTLFCFIFLYFILFYFTISFYST